MQGTHTLYNCIIILVKWKSFYLRLGVILRRFETGCSEDSASSDSFKRVGSLLLIVGNWTSKYGKLILVAIYD